MEGIRSWWEVPCVAHFCHIFQKPFKLPSFEIEELEDALLLDCFPTPSKLLVEIFCRFLDGIIDTEINENNWPLMLKLHLKWRCDNLKEKWNPLSGETEYKDLDIYSRVSIMHKLCHWRLELDDIGDLLRGIDGPSLRLGPVGRDMDGNTYWHFYGTRLYKEEAKKKKKKKDGNEEVTPAKAGARKGKEVSVSTGKKKGPQNKGTMLASQRGRSKQVIQENATPTGAKGRRSARTSKKNQQAAEEEEEASNDGDNEVEEGSGSEEKDGEEPEDEDNSSEKKTDGEVSNGAANGTPSCVGVAAEKGWMIACSEVEEWNELIESFRGSKHNETKRLLRTLQELLPEVEYLHAVRQKQLKKRMLEELPRRTSDRIAIKAAIREEEERMEAMEREMQREELRKLDAEEMRVKEEEAETKRQKRMEEALQRRKAREEQQVKQRMEEETNWEKAMSGELKGRRKAAIGAAENVSEVQMAENFLLTEKDFDLYTAMHKILAGLRKHEEFWVFEDPVTEAIAPGYFEVVDKPMDYSTVEKKVEEQAYKDKNEFIADIELIYDNCCDYNGEDSEYFELSEEVRKLFRSLVGVHFEGKSSSEDVPEGKVKKGARRDSRSPSACKTPELTSESSSEEGSDDESDESYTEGGVGLKRPKGKGGSVLKLTPSLEQRLGSGFHPPRMPHPHHMMGPHGPPPPPHLYHHFMQQYMQHRMPRPPNMPGPPGPDMYPPGAPYPPPRLPPPYPGFPPDHASPPRPPPGAMYRHHPENPGMYGSPDMMAPPRPMYPPAHAYPPPPASHPAHPAHPHHAAYRQHMFYEMQYHGMDPRMMGMRPGMRPVMGPGFGPRPPFSGMRPTSSHSEVDPSGTTREHRHKLPETPSNSEEEVKKGGKKERNQEQTKEGSEKEEDRRKEGREERKKEQDNQGIELEQGKERMEEEQGDLGRETGQGNQGREVEQSGGKKEHLWRQVEQGNQKEPGDQGRKVEVENHGREVDGKKEQGREVDRTVKQRGGKKEQGDEEREVEQREGKKEQGNDGREVELKGVKKEQGNEEREMEQKMGRNEQGKEVEEGKEGRNDNEQDRAEKEVDGQGENAGGSKVKEEVTQEDINEAEDSQKEKVEKPALAAPKDKAPMTPEQIEKYRYFQHHQHMMALQHQQRREAMARGYPFPPHPPVHPDEAAYYSHHQYGGFPPPNFHAADPRQMEAAHHYWMEMEARKRQYAMMKQAQQAHHRMQQREGGGSKERSAETGQEGLEDVPDYQESLRKYTLGLGEQGVHEPPPPAPHNKEQSEASATTANRTPGENHTDSRKRKAPSHSSPHMFPGMPPPHALPNGYPPYPYLPAAAASHHHFPVPDGSDRRNGASGYPPDAYYPPHAALYRMPPYPPYPNTPKSDELRPKQTVTDDTTENVATPPAAKRPRPSS